MPFVILQLLRLCTPISRGSRSISYSHLASGRAKGERKSLICYLVAPNCKFPILTILTLLLFHCQEALERYKKMRGNAPERLVSGSDDFTMFLWEPAVSKDAKTRMTGHQQVNNLSVL